MVKTDVQRSENNAIDEHKDVIDFVLWKVTLRSELPKFWNYFIDEDKRVFVQCLLSLWLFSFIMSTMVNLGTLG